MDYLRELPLPPLLLLLLLLPLLRLLLPPLLPLLEVEPDDVLLLLEGVLLLLDDPLLPERVVLLLLDELPVERRYAPLGLDELLLRTELFFELEEVFLRAGSFRLLLDRTARPVDPELVLKRLTALSPVLVPESVLLTLRAEDPVDP